MSDSQAEEEVGEDTAAFRRYYLNPGPQSHGLLYRLFVGWWRDRGGAA